MGSLLSLPVQVVARDHVHFLFDQQCDVRVLKTYRAPSKCKSEALLARFAVEIGTDAGSKQFGLGNSAAGIRFRRHQAAKPNHSAAARTQERALAGFDGRGPLTGLQQFRPHGCADQFKERSATHELRPEAGRGRRTSIQRSTHWGGT